MNALKRSMLRCQSRPSHSTAPHLAKITQLSKKILNKVVLASVDTQRTWLEYLVAAVGPRGEIWCLEVGTINGRLETDAEAMYTELDQRLLAKRWLRPDGRLMQVARCFQDSGGHAGEIVHRMVKQRARVLWAYRGSGDLRGPWKRGTDSMTHTRLVQGNASHLKEMLAAKLDIAVPGPGFIHFPLGEGCGFDEEFFRQLLSERREKRMRNGVMSIRWVQIRERNEALDLICMILCCALTYRGAIDTMAPQTVSEGDVAASATVTAPTTNAPPFSRTNQESSYGVLEGSERLAARQLSGWGVQSRVAPGKGREERRSFGVQPSSFPLSDIWNE